MNAGQIEKLRADMGIGEGQEWDKWSGVGDNTAKPLEAFLGTTPIARMLREPVAATIPVPVNFPMPAGDEQSPQAAFGRVMLNLASHVNPKFGSLSVGRSA